MEIHIHVVHILMEIIFVYLAVGFFKEYVETHSPPTLISKGLPHFLHITPKSPMFSSSKIFQWLQLWHLTIYSHIVDLCHKSAKVPLERFGVPEYTIHL